MGLLSLLSSKTNGPNFSCLAGLPLQTSEELHRTRNTAFWAIGTPRGRTVVLGRGKHQGKPCEVRGCSRWSFPGVRSGTRSPDKARQYPDLKGQAQNLGYPRALAVLGQSAVENWPQREKLWGSARCSPQVLGERQSERTCAVATTAPGRTPAIGKHDHPSELV